MKIVAFRIIILIPICLATLLTCLCSGEVNFSGRTCPLKRLYQLILDEYKHDFEQIVGEIKTKFENEYFPISEPVQDIHGDLSDDKHITHVKPDFPFHIPLEKKKYYKFSSLRYVKHETLDSSESPLLRKIKGMDSALTSNEIFFPRMKHFRKNLPKLTSEPYQRLMTFAIDICLIPSMWYLELIHCMYIGVAPYFDGMLSSYSLQDVVGSAIKTMGYLDETFSIENCYMSVSLFSDDNVSPYYREACESMMNCLLSKDFQQEKYSKLRDEFKSRIDNLHTYDTKSKKSTTGVSMWFIRTALFIESNDFFPTINHPERNFLPIRIMVASITVSIIHFVLFPNLANSVRTLITAFFDIFSAKTLFDIKIYMKYCKSFLRFYLKKGTYQSEILYEILCKEFLSIGFVDNQVEVLSENKELFAAVTVPRRILDPGYYLVIPEMLEEMNIADYAQDWLAYLPSDDASTKNMAKPELKYSKRIVYKSKALKKTRRKVQTNGISASGRVDGSSSKKPRRTRIRTRLTKLLTNKGKTDISKIKNSIFKDN
ncbi:putative Secreted Protein [Cryptosporidium xiaoi]|uniref:Secreted Protein n=1 Tax=Cryptosporidium xiaoi TaxID=659607 RepID=A0AAV9Y2N7_9CRYT